MSHIVSATPLALAACGKSHSAPCGTRTARIFVAGLRRIRRFACGPAPRSEAHAHHRARKHVRHGLLVLLIGTAAAQDAPFAKVESGAIVSDAVDSFAVAIGDLDGDGNLDVVAGSGPGAPNLVYRGLGDGTFVQITNGPLANDTANTSDVAFADVDGDGDLDVYLTARFSGANALYRNQGGAQGGTPGTFVRDFIDPSVLSVANSECCVFADFDDDGDLDLFVGNTGGQDDFYFRNNGGLQLGVEGTFTRILAGPVVTSGGSTFGCTAGDIDGDGDVDLFVARGAGEDNLLYTNAGGGFLLATTSVVVSQQGGNSRDALLADVDGDGDLDLVVANLFEPNFVYRNRGGDQGGVEGNFEPLPTSLLALQDGASLALAASDWDSDGDLDFAFANCCGQSNDFVETLDDWTFLDVASGPEVDDGGYSNDIGFGDFDADGDDELFVANSLDVTGARRNFLYTNEFVAGGFTTVGPGIPGTFGVPFLAGNGALEGGQDITFFTANVAPSAVTFLVIGVSDVSLPFKSGVLYPDPSFQIAIPSDATGFWFVTSTWPFGVPEGLDLYYQTWVADAGAPAGFAASNGLKSTTPQF